MAQNRSFRRRGRSLPVLAALLVVGVGVSVGAVTRLLQSNKSTVSSGVTLKPTDAVDRDQPSETPASRFAWRQAFELPEADIANTAEAPALAVDARGTLYLAWSTETSPVQRTLVMTRSDDAGKSFATPWPIESFPIHVSVSEVRGRRIERRLYVMPHLRTYQDTLHLAWVRGAEDRKDVALVLASSQDRGASFSQPIRVHENDQARPSYTGMDVGPMGHVALSWLDNRSGSQQAYAAIKHPDRPTFEPEQLVDAGQDDKGICPCCPTQPSIAPDSTVWFAYRGHVDGYRDMWLSTRRLDAEVIELSPPMSVVEPTWTFDGCPHDGPSLACFDSHTVVAWMDASSGQSRVYVTDVASNPEDRQPSAARRPIDVSFPGAQEQPSLVVDRFSRPGQSIVHAVWSGTADATGESTEHSGAGHASAAGNRWIYHAASDDEGKTFGPGRPLSPEPGRMQSRAKMTVGPEGEVYVAYFELSDEGKRLVIGRLDADATPAPGSLTGVNR